MQKAGPGSHIVAKRAIAQEKRRRAQQAKKDAKAAEKLREEVTAQNVSQEIADDALAYLLQETKTRGFEALDEIAKTNWLSERMVNASILSRKQHYEQIAEAYAMYAVIRKDQTVASALLAASKRRGRELNGRTSALRLILELYLTYGDDSDQKARKQAQNLHARDVAAVEHLMSLEIKPSEVLEFSEKEGQGLDEWAFKREGGGAERISRTKGVRLFFGWNNVVTWQKRAPNGSSVYTVSKGELAEEYNNRINALLRLANELPFENRIRPLKPPKSERQ